MSKATASVGYLERGLWRRLFKLEHAAEGGAVVLPSRFLIASALMFDRVGSPSGLARITRDFASGRIEGVRAVNRVPYEVPGKDALCFCELDVPGFAGILDDLAARGLLGEYDEGQAYQPGAAIGDRLIDVTPDGRLVAKTYVWDDRPAASRECLATVEGQLETDPDFLDACAGQPDGQLKRDEQTKRLGFVEGCIRAAKRDGAVPILDQCNSLLPLLLEDFPEAGAALNTLRVLVEDMGRVRISVGDLAALRERSAVRELRAGLRSAGPDADFDRWSEAFLSHLREAAARPTVPPQAFPLPPKCWPNHLAHVFPERASWAGRGVGEGRLLLIFRAETERGPACIGYTRAYFDSY